MLFLLSQLKGRNRGKKTQLSYCQGPESMTIIVCCTMGTAKRTKACVALVRKLSSLMLNVFPDYMQVNPIDCYILLPEKIYHHDPFWPTGDTGPS